MFNVMHSSTVSWRFGGALYRWVVELVHAVLGHGDELLGCGIVLHEGLVVLFLLLAVVGGILNQFVCPSSRQGTKQSDKERVWPAESPETKINSIKSGGTDKSQSTHL